MLDKMTNQLGFQGNALILRAERQRIIARIAVQIRIQTINENETIIYIFLKKKTNFLLRPKNDLVN